jgi:hypothetical protein
MCACSGERAACVTGPAAGEGEGRSASAPAKRGSCVEWDADGQSVVLGVCALKLGSLMDDSAVRRIVG